MKQFHMLDMIQRIWSKPDFEFGNFCWELLKPWFKILCKHKQNSENGPLFQFCWVSLCIWTSCQYQSRWVFVNSGLRWNIAKFDFRQIFMFHDWAAFSLSCMSLIAWCIFILCKIFSIIIGNMISLTSSEMPSPTQF